MFKTLLQALVLFTFTSSGAIGGPPDDKIAQRVTEPYPGYAKACGYPILFRKTASISEARIDPRLGPMIVVDPVLLYPAQQAHRRFMIAHECAHLKFGHTTPKGLLERTRDKGVEDQELSADCWAAEALFYGGYSVDVRFVVDLFYRQGLHSPGSGYPSGVQRSTLIYHCLKTAQRRQSEQENKGSAKID